ncbi:MAG: efflux RND transporter periplasmic adaptor subunit [Ignavibacteria bacterium]|nr:efflux RND transporter periplasmic adaptor subunit [Ignavibacteria bacterium]
MKNIIYFLIFIVTGSLILQSCGNDGETKTENEKKLQAVKIKEIISEPFQENYKVVGIVKPFESAKISSEEGGLITYQPFDKGSRVGRGQVVVRLRKDQDAAAYEQAITQFELAKSNFERMEKLYNESVSTEQDYTNAKFQLELSERALDVLETRLDKSYVVSPISGIVDQKYLGKGEVCGPGTPILNVVDVSRVKISAGIPESYVGEVTKGSKVKITFDVYPDEEYSGIVNYVSPVLSQTNRTFEIEVVLNNKSGKLKPEMSANIEVEKTKIEKAVVLAQDLIIDFGSEKYVFVMDNDIAKKKTVSLGGRNGNNVMINSGLNEGEKLIIEGFQSVADGDKVQVIN